MPNLLFISANELFAKDLQEQITFYAKDFNILNEEDDSPVDVIILDENAEDLKNIRKQNLKVPVFWLTSQDEESVTDAACNHIFYKPFSLDAFLNELKSSINRFENSTDGYLRFNDYILRPVKKEILNRRNSEVLKLTEKEVAIIKYLYKAKDRIVSKNELLQEVWGYSPDVSTHTVETHVYRLRQKVEQEDLSAQLIITLDGGYQLKV